MRSFFLLVVLEHIVVQCIKVVMYIGSAALSYGEYLHATRNFLLAKKFYQKVIEVLAEQKDFSDMNTLGSCNMALEEVDLAATFALGQLEAHMG